MKIVSLSERVTLQLISFLEAVRRGAFAQDLLLQEENDISPVCLVGTRGVTHNRFMPCVWSAECPLNVPSIRVLRARLWFLRQVLQNWQTQEQDELSEAFELLSWRQQSFLNWHRKAINRSGWIGVPWGLPSEDNNHHTRQSNVWRYLHWSLLDSIWWLCSLKLIQIFCTYVAQER